jgi:hypothetical protein
VHCRLRPTCMCKDRNAQSPANYYGEEEPKHALACLESGRKRSDSHQSGKGYKPNAERPAQ